MFLVFVSFFMCEYIVKKIREQLPHTVETLIVSSVDYALFSLKAAFSHYCRGLLIKVMSCSHCLDLS